MPILPITNTVYMQDYMKKFLLLLFVIFVLFAFFFLGGGNYIKKNLASFPGIITAWVTINPLEVDVSAPAEVEIGKVFKVEARVINKGEEKIENGKGEIFLPLELILVQKDPVKEIGVIPGKREKKTSWSVKGEKEGNYVISVKASGELRGQLIEAEDSVMVNVKISLQGRSFWQWFQEILGFFKI